MDIFDNIKGVTLLDSKEYDEQVKAVEIEKEYMQIVLDSDIYHIFYKGSFVAELYINDELTNDEIINYCYEDIKEAIFRADLGNKEYKNMLTNEDLLNSLLDW